MPEDKTAGTCPEGGCDEEILVRRPIAVQELSVGIVIEILQIEDGKVTWRTDDTEERTSKLDETGEAFRTGRVWRRLADFERVR
jgi:hypothetical protein